LILNYLKKLILLFKYHFILVLRVFKIKNTEKEIYGLQVEGTEHYKRNYQDISNCSISKWYCQVNPYVKLDEKAIRWIIREKKKGTPTKVIAEIEGISTRVNQIHREYRKTGKMSKLKKLGRPVKNLTKRK